MPSYRRRIHHGTAVGIGSLNIGWDSLDYNWDVCDLMIKETCDGRFQKMTKFVFDKNAAVEVSALRWVKKSDVRSNLGDKKMQYLLEISYRASTGTIYYKSKVERDHMFDKICKATLPRKNPKTKPVSRKK